MITNLDTFQIATPQTFPYFSLKITPDERRAFMKKNGLTTSANQREEEPVLITSTGAIFEEFLPKESESGMSQMSTKEVCNALPTLPKT